MSRRKFSDAKMIEALESARGVQAAAARSLGCNRVTVARYIADLPKVGGAYESINESQLDFAEGRLTQLIVAVDDTLALPPPDEFADGQGGSSGGSSSGDKRPIPHVAELMVLRAMQIDLNERTSALAEDMNLQQADERQLDSARRLGLEQEQLRALTLRVTQQARSGMQRR